MDIDMNRTILGWMIVQDLDDRDCDRSSFLTEIFLWPPHICGSLNHGQTIGKWWFNSDLMGSYGMYPMVMTNITMAYMENHHATNGYINYFYAHFP